MYEQQPIVSARGGSVKRYVALFLWLLLAGMFLSVARQWVLFSSSDKQLTEYVQSLLQRAAVDRQSPKEVRMLVLMKAEQLSIPVQHERIDVTGQGETLRTNIAYDTEIKIPLLHRVLYRVQFNHNLSYRAPR
jgi:hypothetical protein